MRTLIFEWIDWVQLVGLSAGLFTMAYRLVRTDTTFKSALWVVFSVPFFILFPFFFGNEVFSINLALTARNFSIVALLAGLYLKYQNGPAKVLIVPGILSAVGFGVLSGLCGLGNLFGGAGNNSFATNTLEQHTRAMGQSNTFLLELGPDDSIEELAEVLHEYNASYEQAFPRVTPDEDIDLAQYYLIECESVRIPSLMRALRTDTENVDNVESNDYVGLIPTMPIKSNFSPTRTDLLANDPMLNQQWHLSNANELYTLLKSLKPKKKATVAIVDTGVEGTHEDIDDVFVDSPGAEDKNGHGTHCAGLAGAVTNNKAGIASLNWEGKFIQIKGYKALSNNGGGTVESVADAIIAAAEDGADVISLSLGAYRPVPPQAEVLAIKYALKRGAIVVVAAGNDSDDAKNYAPANIPGVITVAATDLSGKPASFTNQNAGLEMALSAPGVGMLSLKAGGGYVEMSGTSMATPVVAGLLGVMRAMEPTITAKVAFQRIENQATTITQGNIGKKIEPLRVLQTYTRPL